MTVVYKVDTSTGVALTDTNTIDKMIAAHGSDGRA